MKRAILTIIIISFVLDSCKKNSSSAGTSALTIVNAIPNSNALLMNFTANSSKTGSNFGLYNEEYQNTGGISLGSYVETGNYTGITNLSLVQVSDTVATIFTGTLNLQIGGVYSLFLTGTDTLHIDTLFTKDNIPYYPPAGDSVIGVRFLNLVAGSNPISIDIQGNPNNTPVLSSLPYKLVSPFQTFPANANSQNNGYTFEFRDATSGNLLATYSLSILPFKSQTLAYYGSDSSGLSVLEVNDF